jgi:addiction module HigA family antidote
MSTKLKNIHPGEILLEEFLLPMTISQNMLARDINVSPRRINEIVHGKRAITADTDLRLSKALGTSEGFWLSLQADYDLEEKKNSIRNQLNKIKKLINLDASNISLHAKRA